MNEIIVRLIDLPVELNGFTALDEQDDYNVYLNARLSEEDMKQTFLHEMGHILYGHFYDQRPVEEKEQEVRERRPQGPPR